MAHAGDGDDARMRQVQIARFGMRLGEACGDVRVPLPGSAQRALRDARRCAPGDESGVGQDGAAPHPCAWLGQRRRQNMAAACEGGRRKAEGGRRLVYCPVTTCEISTIIDAILCRKSSPGVQPGCGLLRVWRRFRENFGNWAVKPEDCACTWHHLLMRGIYGTAH